MSHHFCQCAMLSRMAPQHIGAPGNRINFWFGCPRMWLLWSLPEVLRHRLGPLYFHDVVADNLRCSAIYGLRQGREGESVSRRTTAYLRKRLYCSRFTFTFTLLVFYF